MKPSLLLGATCAVFLGVACLNEATSDPPRTETTDPMTGGGGSPGDAAIARPDDDPDAAGPAPAAEITPVAKSEFVFKRGLQLLAYDVVARSERVLFAAPDEGFEPDLSPDRKWLVMISGRGRVPGRGSPLWKASVDGAQWTKVYQLEVMNTDKVFYSLDYPTWSIDASKVFYGLHILGFTDTSFFTAISPNFTAFDGKSPSGSSTCDIAGKMRPYPDDPNLVLIYQTKTCAMMARGLNEFTVAPLAPRRIVVPGTELAGAHNFDWLPDGSGLIYEGTEGLTRFEFSSGAKTAFFKLTDPDGAIDDLAVGPAGEIIVALRTKGPDPDHPAYDLFRVMPDSGQAVALTTGGTSRGPSW
jgi:hypothetical protein